MCPRKNCGPTSNVVVNYWRRLTTTPYARTLEDELALERATIARQSVEIAQQGIEAARLGAEIQRQGAEIIRLRAENRALLNSILGIAGIPPLPATEADLATVQQSLHIAPPFSSTGNPACAAGDTQLDRATPASTATLCHPEVAAATEGSQGNDSPRTHGHTAPHLAAPMRRRSWPQIHRLLEFESAQKGKSAADPLPPARQ